MTDIVLARLITSKTERSARNGGARHVAAMERAK
jgi:hypothetical protein